MNYSRPRFVLGIVLFGLLYATHHGVVQGQLLHFGGGGLGGGVAGVLGGRKRTDPKPQQPAAIGQLQQQQQQAVVPPPEEAIPTAVATSTTVIAGKCREIWKKLKKVDFSQIHLGLNHHLDWNDLVWLGAIGWLTEPASRLVYRILNRQTSDDDNVEDDEAAAEAWSVTHEKEYKQTWLYRISNFIGQFGRVVSLVYVTDIATLVLRKMGFQIPPGFNRRMANLIYSVFGAQKIRQAKHWWLRRWFGKHMSEASLVGREKLVEVVIDASIGLLLFFMIQDIFSLTMGRSLQSLFAIGGISGIMISLASKGELGTFFIFPLCFDAPCER